LEKILNNSEYDSGYVYVKDRFGEYGIVGFYSVRDGVTEHFVFSCRILGMGIEQYVYAKLGFPRIEPVGEVVSILDDSVPPWINADVETEDNEAEAVGGNVKILFKGPCDIQTMFSFIKGNEDFYTEMTFVNDNGVLVENQNHTVNILNSFMLSKEEKESFADLPFYDEAMFSGRMFEEKFDVIVFSTLTDQGLGVYRNKANGKEFAFGEAAWPMTDINNHQAYAEGKLFTAYCDFSKEFLEGFTRDYEYVGRLSVEQYMKNLSAIKERIAAGTKLVLILGSEMEFKKEKSPAYAKRHIRHAEVNRAIREWAKEKSDVHLIDVNDYIQSQSDFYNNINHYMKHVYYKMAKRLLEIIKSECNMTYEGNKKEYFLQKCKQIVKKLLKR